MATDVHLPNMSKENFIITGPPTHSVGGPVLFCSSVSVVVCDTPRRRMCIVTHQGAARDGGPVLLRPVRARPFCSCSVFHFVEIIQSRRLCVF